jgi:hypothetical protein
MALLCTLLLSGAVGAKMMEPYAILDAAQRASAESIFPIFIFFLRLSLCTAAQMLNISF